MSRDALGAPPERADVAGRREVEDRSRAAKVAVSLVFATSGLSLSSWFARVPEIQQLLDLTPGQLGLLLLCLSLGSVTALPLAGVVVRRLGTARTVALGCLAVAAGVALAGLGAQVLALAVLTGAALVAVGAAMGCWDVAMNVEGAAVERRLGRTILPRFHAAWSIGTVVGALVAFGASAVGVPVAVHLGVVAVVVAAVTTAATTRFLPVAPDSVSAAAEHGGALLAWREPRTLLLGLLVLCAAFTEGVANDWLAIGLRDGYGTTAAVGVLGFAFFVTAMTVGRLVIGPVLDRVGRVPVIVTSFAAVVVGAVVVVFSPVLWLALVGTVVWGLGASVGFPLGISAAADGGNSEARVSVVATLGYTAFLAGPPLLGALGDRVGVHPALLVVAVVSVPGMLLARSARPPEGASAAPGAAGA